MKTSLKRIATMLRQIHHTLVQLLAIAFLTRGIVTLGIGLLILIQSIIGDLGLTALLNAKI